MNGGSAFIRSLTFVHVFVCLLYENLSYRYTFLYHTYQDQKAFWFDKHILLIAHCIDISDIIGYTINGKYVRFMGADTTGLMYFNSVLFLFTLRTVDEGRRVYTSVNPKGVNRKGQWGCRVGFGSRIQDRQIKITEKDKKLDFLEIWGFESGCLLKKMLIVGKGKL